jgi:hypothetical protein
MWPSTGASDHYVGCGVDDEPSEQLAEMSHL